MKRIVLKGRNANESSSGWDDWEDIEGFEQVISDAEDLAYELRSLVRGATTRCKDWSDLADYVERLGETFVEVAGNIADKTDESVVPKYSRKLPRSLKKEDGTFNMETGHSFNERLGAITRNASDNCFLIDCGTPENAVALADAIQKEAYGYPMGSAKDDAGRHFLGGEIIQFWPVGRYFSACVDPCDKAIEWCENWLKDNA